MATGVRDKLLKAAGVPDVAGEEERDVIAEASQMLEDGDPAGAAAVFKELYTSLMAANDGETGKSMDKDKLLKQAKCLVGLAKCAQASGDDAAVTELLKRLKTSHSLEIASDAAIAQEVASLELSAAMDTPEAGSIAALEQALEVEPEDHESRFTLAQHLFQQARFEEAVNHGLHIIKRDSGWNEGAAKDLLLKFFESLGPDHELTKQGRRRLTNLLFV